MTSAPALFSLPPSRNELPLDYAPGSPERAAVDAELARIAGTAVELPLRIGGRDVETGRLHPVSVPHDHRRSLAQAHWAGPGEVEGAIAAAAAAWEDWSRMAWEDRAAIFLRASELARGPWRARLNAVTMLNLSKTVREAEIDAACETADYLQFNVRYMREMYEMQPESLPGTWNRLEYRPLEGFVLAITPFNFLCLANLAYAPAMMGNVVLWKPAEQAELCAWAVLQMLEEAGPAAGRHQPGLRRRRRGRAGRAHSPQPGGGALHRLDRDVPGDLEDDRRQHRRLPQLPAHRRRDRRQGLHRRPRERRPRGARDLGRPRRVRVPGPEVLRAVAHVRPGEPVARPARPPAGRGAPAARRRPDRPERLRRRRHRRRRVREAPPGHRRVPGRRRDRRRRRAWTRATAGS